MGKMETRFLTEKAQYGKNLLTLEGIYQDMGLTTKGEYLVYRESQGESRLNYLDSPSSGIGKFFLNSLTLFPDTYQKSVLLPYQNTVNLSDALRAWSLETKKEVSLGLVDADVQETGIVGGELISFSRAWSSSLSVERGDTRIMSEFLSLLVSLPLPTQTLSLIDGRKLEKSLERGDTLSVTGIGTLGANLLKDESVYLDEVLRRLINVYGTESLTQNEISALSLMILRTQTLDIIEEFSRHLASLKEKTLNYNDLKEVANIFTRLYSDALSYLDVLRPYQAYLIRSEILGLTDQRISRIELRKEEPSDVVDQFIFSLALSPFQEVLAKEEISYFHFLRSLQESVALTDALLPLGIKALRTDPHQIFDADIREISRLKENVSDLAEKRTSSTGKAKEDFLSIQDLSSLKTIISIVHSIFLTETSTRVIGTERIEQLSSIEKSRFFLMKRLADASAYSSMLRKSLRPSTILETLNLSEVRQHLVLSQVREEARSIAEIRSIIFRTLEEEALYLSVDQKFLDLKEILDQIHTSEAYFRLDKLVIEEILSISDASSELNRIILSQPLSLAYSYERSISKPLEDSYSIADKIALIGLFYSDTVSLVDIRRGGIIGPPSMALANKMPALALANKIGSIGKKIKARGETT